MKKAVRKVFNKLMAVLSAIIRFINKNREILNKWVTYFSAGAQVCFAGVAFYTQVKDSDDHTKGLSVGMFLSLTIFNGVNVWLGFGSLKHSPMYTREKVLKFVQYLFGTAANFIYFIQCMHTRKIHGEVPWHSDDSWQIFILLVGYVLFIAYLTEEKSETFHETVMKSIRDTFKNKIAFGFLMGFTVLIAHGMWGYHILKFGTQGVLPQFLKFTLIGIVCRFIQNAFDMWAAGTDPEKKSLLMGEGVSLITWAAIIVISDVKK